MYITLTVPSSIQYTVYTLGGHVYYTYSSFKYTVYSIQYTVYTLGGNVWGYKEGEGMEKTAGTKG